jgi:hypothetical protein
MGATSAFGQRMFLLPAGVPPTQPTGDYTVEAKGGDTLTFDAYLEDAGCPVGVRTHQTWFACDATGGDTGSITFTSGGTNASVDQTRTDYIFFGFDTYGAVENQGNCPSGNPDIDGPRCSQTGQGTPEPPGYPPVTTAKYLSTWSFDISTDASGVFTLRPHCPTPDPDPPCTYDKSYFVCADNSVPSYTQDSLIVEIPTGSCCVGQDCYGTGGNLGTTPVTRYECEDVYGGIFRANAACPGGGGPACACYSDAECQALTDVCHIGKCNNPGDFGTCEDPPAAVDCSMYDTDCTYNTCDLSGGLHNCDILNNRPDSDPQDQGTWCPDDVNPCTADLCESGTCVHVAAEEFPAYAGDPACGSDADCQVYDGSWTCNTGTGACVCAVVVCIEVEEMTRGLGVDPDDCVDYGAPVVAKVVLGSGGAVGVQGRVEWDPTKLVFNGIEPGFDCDVDSVFINFIDDPVIGEEGWVFFAVDAGEPQISCPGPGDLTGCPSYATECRYDPIYDDYFCWPVAAESLPDTAAACLYFDTIECEHGRLCLCEEDEFGYVGGKHDPPDCNPHDFRIVNAGGAQVPWQECPDDPCADVVPDTQIAITCPDDINQTADCHETTAMVEWDCPVATDECGVVGPIICECNPLLDSPECPDEDENGVVDWLEDCGGEFPQGSWLFHCSVEDLECEDTAECYWTVTVNDETFLDVFVQLSPNMDPGPFTRCIEFQLWTACSPLIVGDPFCVEMEFGGDYHGPGKAEDLIKVPKGQYMCLTARDPAHTLRSSDFIECDEETGMFMAEFKDDPFFGGNWLINGNLDGTRTADTGSPRAIDIIDYGVFVSQFLTAQDINMTCPVDCTASLWPSHADINADGFVDDIDFSFISINFLEYDKDACCPERAAIEPGLTSITLREAKRMGLDLSDADLNGDNVVDLNDMAAFMGGARPKAPRSTGHK